MTVVVQQLWVAAWSARSSKWVVGMAATASNMHWRHYLCIEKYGVVIKIKMSAKYARHGGTQSQHNDMMKAGRLSHCLLLCGGCVAATATQKKTIAKTAQQKKIRCAGSSGRVRHGELQHKSARSLEKKWVHSGHKGNLSILSCAKRQLI